MSIVGEKIRASEVVCVRNWQRLQLNGPLWNSNNRESTSLFRPTFCRSHALRSCLPPRCYSHRFASVNKLFD